MKHPSIVPAFDKEIYFFNGKFHKGINWYRTHFPLLPYKYYVTKICRQNFSPARLLPVIFFIRMSPKRVSEVLPHVKIIVLLRNPVDRAYSHYYHEVRKKRETLSFEDAIKTEEERLRGEFEKLIKNERYKSSNYIHYSISQEVSTLISYSAGTIFSKKSKS